MSMRTKSNENHIFVFSEIQVIKSWLSQNPWLQRVVAHGTPAVRGSRQIEQTSVIAC